jgi:hypothetical protein
MISSRTVPDASVALGWKPKKTEDDFKNHFLQEAKMIVEETSGKHVK